MLNKQRTASLNNHLWRKRRRRFIRRHYEPVGRESVGSVCCVNDGNKLHINMRAFTGLTQEAVSSGWGQTNRQCQCKFTEITDYCIQRQTRLVGPPPLKYGCFLRYAEVRTEIIGANWLKWEKTTTANLWKSCNLHWVTNKFFPHDLEEDTTVCTGRHTDNNLSTEVHLSLPQRTNVKSSLQSSLQGKRRQTTVCSFSLRKLCDVSYMSTSS